MRRLAAAAITLLVCAGVLVAVGAGGAGPRSYRVDALFDNADFLVVGQDVKIAGAVVGDVTGVHVTRDHKARIEMEVQQGFAPFRSDASCEIRPESLIGEKFVGCDPGSPRGRPLVGQGGHPPTVPVANDHSPVDLDLVFAALRLPFRQRLALIVNELGSGLAGRPADLNAAIRRANPALQQTSRVLAILDADRNTLGRLIDASDTVLAELARHRGDVGDFIDRANTVAQSVAGRRGDLGESIRRLPPLLAQLQPASVELTGFANEARPVARDLRAAAPSVNAALGDLPPLNAAAVPALPKLSELAQTGRRAVRVAGPVAQRLLPVADRLPELSLLARQLNENRKARGVVEGLLTFVYLSTAATDRFDQFSHILPSYQVAGPCQQYATAPAAGCSAHWGGGGAEKQKSSRPRAAARRGRHRSRRHSGQTQPAGAPPLPAASPPAASPTVPSLHALPTPQPPPPPTSVPGLLNYLLGP